MPRRALRTLWRLSSTELRRMWTSATESPCSCEHPMAPTWMWRALPCRRGGAIGATGSGSLCGLRPLQLPLSLLDVHDGQLAALAQCRTRADLHVLVLYAMVTR